MQRRNFLLSGAAAALVGCAVPMAVLAPTFSSDRISVLVQGVGPDVVLIPGLGSSRDVWSQLVREVPGYRYHLVQLNGFAGHTPLGNAAGEVISSATEEIARYIRTAALGRPSIIGHSMGGTITLGLAARHDVVGKVMIVDMLPFLGIMFGPPGATAETIRSTADALRDASLKATADARRLTVAANIATMVKPGPLRDGAVADALASDSQVTAAAYHELIVTDLRPELGSIRVPVTVLYVKTPNVPLSEDQFDALYKASYADLRNATLKRIDGSLHFVMHDQPKRFAAEVSTFLR